jgi:integrase
LYIAAKRESLKAMPHHLLTVTQIDRIVEKHTGKPIKHRDGAGLFLDVRAPGQASWTYQFRLNGKTLWGSIGPLRLYTLKQARERHAAIGRIIKEKRDPRTASFVPVTVTAGAAIAEAGEPAGEPLSELLIRYLVDAAPTWKSGKAMEGFPAAKIAQLIRDGKAGKEAKSYTTMFGRLTPEFLTAPAQSINALAFRNAVKAIWPDNGATVARMVRRLGMLLKWQETGEHRGNKPKVTNHPAMPYPDVAAYMRHLATLGTGTAKALRWTILTAPRSGVTLGATWAEIKEIDGGPCWAIPGDAMKKLLPLNVPLPAEMLALIGERRADHELLFQNSGPNSSGGRIWPGAMLHLLKKTHPDLTVHGFRTSFRSWAGDCTDFPREIAEKALAHAIKGVEGDYDRGEKLAKRRLLMEAWCAFALAA